jgi:hypothetical protein
VRPGRARQARCSMVGQVTDWLGEAGRGLAGEVWRVVARRSGAWSGLVRQGMAGFNLGVSDELSI